MQKIAQIILFSLLALACRGPQKLMEVSEKTAQQSTTPKPAAQDTQPNSETPALTPPVFHNLSRPAPDEPLFVFPKNDGSNTEKGRALLDAIEQSEVFEQGFTGFALMDAETGELLAASNGSKYFTPASNTKILTLYTCLHVLGDSMPGMRICEDFSPPLLQPTGDPTFLHPYFAAWQPVFAWAKNHSATTFGIWNDSKMTPLGPGWCWDDATEAYSAERTPMPIYGNVRRVFSVKTDQLDVEPKFWRNYLQKTGIPEPDDLLSFDENQILYSERTRFRSSFERDVPVFGAEAKAAALLQDTLHKKIIYPERTIAPQNWRTIFSCPTDTVLARMMQVSDNFLSEQLLLTCAYEKFGRMDAAAIINWTKENLFNSLPQKVKWVDGSGLSRYNMNTPLNNASLLFRLWHEQPRERLFRIFPAGGQNGTIADWYTGPDGRPFVFAKTGTLTGVHCLSGYVLCSSGKVLTFSFMHNNFPGSSRAYRREMGRFLATIRENF